MDSTKRAVRTAAVWLITVIPLAAGYIAGLVYSITMLVVAAAVEGFEAGRRL